MKLINVLEGAAEVLGLQNTSYSILRRCANLVLANIAANHRDCEARQIFTVTDGKIEYKKFDKNFLRVGSVRVNGAEADYSLFIDFLGVPNGKVEIVYYYVPTYPDDLNHEIFVPNLSEQTFIYGVITEYALIAGSFNEAKAWNEKFEAGLFGTSERNRNLKLKVW